MSKHTPGPWATNGDPYVSTGNGNQAIAFADVRGISKNEAKANARLIAAAPDNYACNIELAKIVRELCGIYGHPLPEASLERSDAAIRKATGE